VKILHCIKDSIKKAAEYLSWKKHLPWCAGLLLIVLVLFGQYLFSSTQVVSQFGNDVYNYYLHTQTFASGELRQGILPVWNPYTYGGHPFLADFQSAMLYPPSWALSLLNPVTAINWWCAFHVFLFGFLVYMWGVFRGLKPGAAFIAGVTAMLGGTFYMHVYAGHLSNLGSMAWAPLVFIGIDGWLRSKHAGWLIAGATGVALQVYAGHPQYVYYTAIGAAVYAFVHLPFLGRQFRRAAIGLILLYPLAALLSAAQLLPGYSAMSEAVRSTGASYDFASMFSFNPENIFTMFAPWIYGGADQVTYWGRCYLWEMQLFIGSGMLVLAALGFASLGKGARWRMGIVLVVLAILMFGAYVSPVYRLLYNYLPFYAAFRGTSKFVYLVGLLAAILAGHGMNRLLTGENRGRKFGIAIICVGALVMIGGLMFGTGLSWRGIFDALTQKWPGVIGPNYFLRDAALAKQPDFQSLAQSLTLREFLFGGAWLMVFGGLILWARNQRKAVWAFGALAVINLGIFAWKATTSFTADQARLQEVGRVFQNKPGQRPNDFRTLNTLLSSANMTWGNENIWGYDPSVLKRYAEFMYYSQGLDPDTASQNAPFRQKSPMLNMFRCRYALVQPATGNLQLADMGEPLSRFMIISRYRVIKNRDEILQTISSPLFDPKREVILESEPIPRLMDGEGVSYSIRLMGMESGKWTLEMTCDKATILVMTDAYAKGWTMTPLPGSVQTNYNVMPANYAMRAIPLAPGRHVVQLEYIQPGLAAGVQTSLLTTALLLIMCIVPFFRRRLDFSVQSELVHASPEDHDIEAVKCANCGADKTKLVCQKQTPGGRVYSMVQCEQCGLAYINPRLKQEAILATYQDSAYFQRGEGSVTGYNDYTIDRDLHQLFFNSQLDSIEKQRPGKGRLLDIGSAFGYLLDEARRRGWQVEGIELSGNALHYSRDELKLTIHDRPLRENNFAPGTFDAIVMDDVIEHYGDPAAEIREVARVLAKGGVYLLHTPNFDSAWRALMGEKWVHLKPEEHLYYFSPTTLSDMLSKNGFNIIYARTRGKATDLAYIFGVMKKFLPFGGKFLERTLGRLPLARKPFNFRGGGFEVMAVKK